MELFLQNILSPAILFFALGIIAGFLKSDLEVPEQIARYLSIYLMMAIGFKGGVAISQTPEFNSQIICVILLGILTGFTQPFIGYFFLKKTTKLDTETAAAVAAHYGSISMVTFVTATTFLETNNISYGGYIVAVLALMEAPAILTGLYIVQKNSNKKNGRSPKIGREIFTNGAILLLTGSFIIGWLSGDRGMQKMHGFMVEPFQGILAFFLMEMGLVVSRQMTHLKEFNLRLVLFGIYMPLIGCIIGLILSYIIGLDVGSATLFIVLIASASYIAVSAAMRIALPKAKAGIYIPMTLAITFPFNIAIGIPLYFYLAQKFLG